MMLPPYLAAPLLVAAALSLLASCTKEAGPAPDVPRTLLDVPNPNPQTMEADVAALINESWKELDEILVAGDTAPEALAAAYAQFGLACFGNGLVIPAEAAFENAVKLAPDQARWIYFLALIRQFTGTLDEAAAGLERVLELLPGDQPALIRLGDIRFEQARLDDARAAYRRVLEVDPESAAAHYGLGRVAGVEGKDLVAVGHYETALAQQPDADRLNYLLGLAWRNLGDAEKAQAYLAKRGVNEPSYPDPLFDAISGGKARIGGLWANMNAGSQAFVDGDYFTAVDEFRVATQSHPDEPRSWQSLGMALNRVGDREGAEQAYLAALDLVDENAVVHHDLATLLLRAGRFDDAEGHLLRAIAIDPQKIDAHTTLARLLANLGRSEEALEHIEAALALDPQSGALIVARAEMLAALGRMDEAVTEIGKAIDLAGDDVERARAHYALGRVHLMRGDGDAVIASIQTALELNPNQRAGRLDLARTFVRARRYEQALDNYEELIAGWPDNDATRVEAAGIALLLGRGPDARRLLEESAVKETATPRLLSSFARLLALATQAGVHDPARSLEYAQRAFDKSRAAQHAETVALCLSAVGRFDNAVQLQERLLTEAGQRADAAERARLAENLKRYRARELGRLPFDAG